MTGIETGPIIDEALRYYTAYKPIVLAVAGSLALIFAFGLGRLSRGRSKPKKTRTPQPLFFAEPASEPVQRKAAAETWAQGTGLAHVQGTRPPVLPLPRPEDLERARRVLDRVEISAQEGIKLHSEGVRQRDVQMAMTGLRFQAQFIAEGGHKAYTSPWWEYKTLADAYLLLGRTHDSRLCLELAYDAFHACYLSIRPEPSTERIEREVLLNLGLLSQELSVRPGV